MKTNFVKQLVLSFAATVFTVATMPGAHAAPASPVGTWDCLSSGAGQPGIAYLTFADDFTFSGELMVAGTPISPPTNPRGSIPSSRGGGSDQSTNSVISTNLFGFWSVEGPWGFDIKGRIVGNFHEVIAVGDVVVKWNTATADTGPISFPVSDYGTDLVTVTNTVSFLVDSGDGTLGYMATTNFARTFSGPSSTRTYNWTVVNLFDGYTNAYTANLTFFNVTNVIYTGVTNFTYKFAAADLTTNVTWTVKAPNGYVNNYSFPFTATNDLGYSLDGVVTNRIGFVGTVVPNKRISLVATPSLGKGHITYSGVPINTNKLTDISGRWTGKKREANVDYIEFFNISPTATPYLFAISGDGSLSGGAGYDVYGYAMVSSKKQIAFTEYEHQWGATNDTLRASTGSLSVSKKAVTAKTKGLHEGTVMTFNAAKPLP